MWKRKSLILSIFLVCIVILIGCRKTQPTSEPRGSSEAKEASYSPEERAAIEAAQAWLELVMLRITQKAGMRPLNTSKMPLPKKIGRTPSRDLENHWVECSGEKLNRPNILQPFQERRMASMS
jgi:hypothetical protein